MHLQLLNYEAQVKAIVQSALQGVSTLSAAQVQRIVDTATTKVTQSGLTAADLAKALTVFEDKTIPISILGNGCSPEAESVLFQQALVELAVTRKDIFISIGRTPASVSDKSYDASKPTVLDDMSLTVSNLSST